MSTSENRYKTLLTAVLAVAFIATFAPVAAANFAGPWYITSHARLHLIHLVIGVLEAVFLTFVYESNWKRTFPLLIVANCVSMNGLWTMELVYKAMGSPPPDWPTWAFPALVLATLVIELPFYYFSFAKEKRTLRRVGFGLVVTNAITNVFPPVVILLLDFIL